MRFLIIGMLTVFIGNTDAVAQQQKPKSAKTEKRLCTYDECVSIAKSRGDSGALAAHHCSKDRMTVCK
jgi:hypothetical protein